MNVVVVGGAGFVGSHLVDRLLADGAEVDVVDNLVTGELANLAEARAAGGRLRINTLDAASAALTDLVVLRRPDVIYHLAAVIPGESRPAALVTESMSITVAVLEAARHVAGTKVVAMLPATALYGEVAARLQPVKESNGWAPVDVRGVAARAVAELLQVYRDSAAVEFTTVVAPSVYGTRQRADGGVVAALLDSRRHARAPVFTGDGRQVRDLLYIDDAVDALVRAGSRAGGLVVNIGTGVGTSVRDLWQLLGGTIDPVLVPRPPGDVLRLTLSPTRARLHLGWASWTDVPAGVADLLAAQPPRPAAST